MLHSKFLPVPQTQENQRGGGGGVHVFAKLAMHFWNANLHPEAYKKA